jgi:hypothetical protein
MRAGEFLAKAHKVMMDRGLRGERVQEGADLLQVVHSREVHIVTEEDHYDVREVTICDKGCHLLIVAEPGDASVFRLSGKGILPFLAGCAVGIGLTLMHLA